MNISEDLHNKTDKGIMAEVDDKLLSQQRIVPQMTNDDEESGMIYHQHIGNKSVNPEQNLTALPPVQGYQVNSTDQPTKLSHQTISFPHLTLKSCIVFLMLISLLMVSAYKIIEQVYQIEHPQMIVINRLSDSRVNAMIQKQKESIKNQKQQIGVQDIKNDMNKKITNQANIPIAQHNLKINPPPPPEVSSKSPIVQQQSPIKTQTKISVNHQTSQKILKQQQETKQSIESQLKQHEQMIESFERKIEDALDKEEAKLMGVDSQVLSEDSEEKGTKDNLKFSKLINSQIKEQLTSKPDQAVHEEVKLSSPQQIKPVSEQPPINPNPSGNTPVQTRLTPRQQQRIRQRYQPAKTSSQSKNGKLPAAKAGITTEQALKWQQYQKMLELPLSAQPSSNPMLLQELNYYERKYNISKYSQLPICVVVPTYNNVKDNRYKDNMKSILQQNYTNYHVVVIDDMSDDHTGQEIEKYVNQLDDPKYKEKIKVIVNKQRKMAMPNLRYAAMHQCQENELFIIVDGDDLLIGRQVFKLFSANMQQRDLWVMWTNFLSPKGTIGYSRDYNPNQRKANNYRKAGFVMSHLRAYYTKLFRQIKEEDLMNPNGEYLHAANDVAIGIPILEMAHQHTGYVPEISYYYNMNTGLNNHHVRLKEQKTNDKMIRKKQHYQVLDGLGFEKDLHKEGEIEKTKEEHQKNDIIKVTAKSEETHIDDVLKQNKGQKPAASESKNLQTIL